MNLSASLPSAGGPNSCRNSELLGIILTQQLIFFKNKAKWFAKQLASESLHGKHQRNKTTLSKHSLTKDGYEMCGRPKAF